MPSHKKGKSGRLLRRPQRGYPAATVAEFCTAVPIAATCETTLVIESLDRHRVGWVWLIHGNGCDVVTDYTQSVDALMSGANALAEQFSDPTMEASR